MGRDRWLLVAALSAALSGCGGMGMGQGVMSAKDGDDAKALNAPLAVGASIQPHVEMNLAGTATPTLVLLSAQPGVVTAEGGRLTGRAPGVSAILVTTKDGEVLDFYHLWVEQASRATLHRLYRDGRDMGEVREGIDLLVGESALLTPRIYRDSQELAGAVQGRWSVDPAVATVLSDGVDERRRLLAVAPGQATLGVKIANVSVSVPLRVLPRSPATGESATKEDGS
jgi:hypothetical protein